MRNVVDESFRHGQNFKIGSFCVIEADVEVGDNVSISNYVMLQKGTKIGNDVHIGPYFRSGGRDVIGNGVIAKIRSTSSPDVVIGDRAFLGPHSLLLHDTRQGVHTPCGLEEDAYIGGGATVMPGVLVGKGATVGVGAVATHDVPEGETVVGVPARKHIR